MDNIFIHKVYVELQKAPAISADTFLVEYQWKYIFISTATYTRSI